MTWLACCLTVVAQQAVLTLSQGWQLASSARVNDTGTELSKPGGGTGKWGAASVPTTVFNALVTEGVYPDPDFGMNLRQVPGESYPVGANFSNLPMPAGSPFAVPWWFRTEFTLPAAWRGRTVWLDFDGINYRANIWLNGQPIAGSEATAGAFRRYEFDVTAAARVGERNALAVEVFPPQPQDLAITFVDWNPLPPDKDMGLWGAVRLRTSGPVAIRNAFVATQLDLNDTGVDAAIAPAIGAAHLTVTADLINASAAPCSGELRGRAAGAVFARHITLAPHSQQTARFTPADTASLNLAHPQLWWPYTMGTPYLQTLRLEFIPDAGSPEAGVPSDVSVSQFGISQITSELTPGGARLFRVNGRRILIRGGGWTPDMLLRDDAARWQDDFDYVRAMHLNTVRLEGKLMSEDFFDLADRMGVLVMAGWCCCDHWEKWADWKDNEEAVATASLRDQALRLRAHPSVLVWLNGSDNPPAPRIEQAYLDVLKQADWPKPILSSASQKVSPVTGVSGVKMTGPYDYVPPDYWLEDVHRGGALGFNTETSPGAAIPPQDSLERFLPADHLWPLDEFWSFHAGGGAFANLGRFNAALSARYGAPRDLDDYIWKAQAAAYEGERAMFEAWGRNKYDATGVIQWMLNNGWPSLIWHLYDYYLRPGAGYFATRLACEPLHVHYADADRTVVVVSDSTTSIPGLVVTADTFDLQSHPLGSRQAALTAAADAATAAFTLPLPAHEDTYFLRLTLRRGGALVDTNFYWLSSKPDVLDDARSLSYITPESAYADLTGLQNLPPAAVNGRIQTSPAGNGDDVAQVRLHNPSDHIAFFVRLAVRRHDDQREILPVRWSDNYISLLPGETRRLTARFHAADAGPGAPTLTVTGWNVAR